MSQQFLNLPMKEYYKNEHARVNWIDIAKGIGMFFVVLGHQFMIPEELSTWIYSFHMPLFFFLSGFVYRQSTSSLKEILKKKMRTLILPYFFIAIVTYVYWLFIGRNFGGDALLNISPLKPLLGIFYSIGVDYWLVFNTPIWFLTCLFCVEVIYDLICRYLKNPLTILFVLLVSSLVGYTLLKLNIPRLPWGLNIAFFAIIFYGIGNFLKKSYLYKQFLQIKSRYTFFALAIAFVFINYFISYYNGRVDMNSGQYGNIFLFYSSAIFGIGAVIISAKFLEQSRLLLYFGKRTLIILGFHGLAGALVKAVQVFIFNKPLSALSDNWALAIIYSCMIFLILVPGIFVLEKYFPNLIGRKQSIR